MGILGNIPKPVEEDVKTMVELYKTMIDSRRRLLSLKERKEQLAGEDVRYSKLEMKSDRAWDGMPQPKQLICVNILISEGYMDPRVADMLTMFDAVIDQKPPEEPCCRIGGIKKC